MNWFDAFDLCGLEQCGKAVVRIAGRSILLMHTSAGIFACPNRCPHEDYPLSEGDLSDAGTLRCNWHNWSFDLVSGCTLVGGDSLERFAVDLRANRIWIALEPTNTEQIAQRVATGVIEALGDADQQRLVRETARLALLRHLNKRSLNRHYVI